MTLPTWPYIFLPDPMSLCLFGQYESRLESEAHSFRA